MSLFDFRLISIPFPSNSMISNIISKVLLVVISAHLVVPNLASPTPEDWVSSGSAFSRFTAEENRDTYTSAFLNVSVLTEDGWKSDKTEVGRYGGGFVGPASGVLVHVTSKLHPNDHSGCELPLYSTRSDRRLPPPGEPWIALVKRGKCNFEVKVENAFRSNAAGVLVYNDRDSSTLDKMKVASDSGRNISAVFTYKWKGEELGKLLSENDSKVYVHITIGAQTSSRSANINRTSVLFVSITFIVLMIISLTWLIFYYVQRFRYIHAKDRLSRRLCNAAKKALSKIPTKNIKSEDKEVQGDGECCAICIEPYKVCDTLRILPCGHEFHKNCIDPWLLEHRTCPMCKMDILKHYGFVFSGSQESILQMDVEEIVVLESNDSHPTSPRRGGGSLSPLPQIRAVMIPDHQRLFDGGDEESSRSSTPDEMTPSLSSSSQNRQQHQQQQSSSGAPASVRQDLCVSCIAAKAAAALTGSPRQDKQQTTTGGSRLEKESSILSSSSSSSSSSSDELLEDYEDGNSTKSPNSKKQQCQQQVLSSSSSSTGSHQQQVQKNSITSDDSVVAVNKSANHQ